MANLDVPLYDPWDQRSGEGVSARRLANEAGFDEAADRGLGVGLNSEAFALRRRGDE